MTSSTLIDRNYTEYARLVDRMQTCMCRGRWSEAAGLAQLTGAYAWLNHTGLFASDEVESGLRQLRDHVPAPTHPAGPADIDVLHVVSQTYATGGPTQAVAQWIDRDPGRRHHVCLTQQGAAPIPEKVLTRTRRGSDLTDLTPTSGGLLERAQRLRALAARAETVIVHSHPHDVVPTLALEPDTRGVLSINHADHVFWLGTSAPGLFVSMRESGRRLAVSRRGVPPSDTALLPRPLSMPARAVSRDEAKRSWEIPADALLIVSAADAPKFQPVSGASLLQMVVPVLEAHAHAYLLVAGPSPTGEWLAAERRSGGRIRALGRLPDVTTLHQAADVYLDSFPFSSLTSLLEAGSFGTPAVTFRGHPQDCAVLGADTPGIDGHLRRPTDAGALQSDLLELLDDERLRLAEGAALREGIASTHEGSAWLREMEHLYRRAGVNKVEAPHELQHTPEPASAVERGCADLDQLVALIQEHTPLQHSVGGAARFALPFLPIGSRVGLWLSALLSREGVSPALLLPPGALATFTRRRRSIGVRRPAFMSAPRTGRVAWSRSR